MKIKNIVGNEHGSVMMEYVVLNFLFMVTIAIAGNFFVDPTGGTPGLSTYKIDTLDAGTGRFIVRTDENGPITSKRYGILGNAFMQRYELMLKIVSMPYP